MRAAPPLRRPVRRPAQGLAGGGSRHLLLRPSHRGRSDGLLLSRNQFEGGDYPPPPRCAALWRKPLLARLPKVELTLLVGAYAQRWALPDASKRSMTETVAAWRNLGPAVIPLPHPSWRSTAWLRRNPWFDEELAPYLRARVAALLGECD